jgi:uncharacterized OB-fold protein
MSSEATRPAPIVTDDSAAFWTAASDGRLVAQRCADCGRYRHPPRPMCPACRSLAVDVVDLSGRGTVYSYAVLHHPQHPAFEFPVVIVLVDLEEGVRVLSNLADAGAADVRIGMPVEVCFAPTAGGMAVPQFRASVPS